MNRDHGRRRRLARVALAALGGGSLCQTCETRLRDAVVDGTRNYISILLDPSLFLADLVIDSADEVVDE